MNILGKLGVIMYLQKWQLTSEAEVRLLAVEQNHGHLFLSNLCLLKAQ